MATLRERAGYLVRRLKARVGVALVQRAGRRRQGLLDRLCTRLLAWGSRPPGPPADHYMRDELVDADVEFDPSELDRYQGQTR